MIDCLFESVGESRAILSYTSALNCVLGGQVTLINEVGSRMVDILVQAVRLVGTIRSINIPDNVSLASYGIACNRDVTAEKRLSSFLL